MHLCFSFVPDVECVILSGIAGFKLIKLPPNLMREIPLGNPYELYNTLFASVSLDFLFAKNCK